MKSHIQNSPPLSTAKLPKMGAAMLKPYLFLSLLLLISAPTQAAENYPQTALGNDGELFALETGNYEELFLDGKTTGAIPGETSVLALSVTLPGEAPERLLVPTSDGAGLDQDAWMVYDKRGGSLNVIWRETTADAVQRILLASYRQGEWGDVFEIHSGAPGAPEPSVALTRDAFEIDIGDDASLVADRQILHLAWRTEIAGTQTVLYSPVIFVEGSYVGWQETFDLKALWNDSKKSSTSNPILPEGLEDALSLEIADDQKSVLIAFADAETASVAVCKIGILPLELAYLSDNIRKRVLMQAAEFDPLDLSSFADYMRLEIIGMGARFGFHNTVVEYVADHIHTRISNEGGQYTAEDLPQLAEDLHDYSIDITSSLLGVEVSSTDDGTIVEIDVSDLIGNPDSGPGQLLDLGIASELIAPSAIGDRPAVIYPSGDGNGMLIAWQDLENGLLLYVESKGDTWSEVKKVSMAQLSGETADQLLRQRAR